MSHLLLLLLCLAISFVLSGMEAGVFALSRWRIRQQMRQGSRRARLLHDYLQDPEHFLWMILISNTLAAVTAFTLFLFTLNRWFHSSVALLIFVYLAGVFAFYYLCDFLPKTLFRTFPNRLTLAAAIPFQVIHLLLSPLARAIEKYSQLLLRWSGGKVFTGQLFASRSEFKLLMQESGAGLSVEERGMITRVLEMHHLTAAQLMTPLAKVVSVPPTAIGQQLLDHFKQWPFAYLPVIEQQEAGPKAVGIVSLRDLIYTTEPVADKRARELMLPPLLLPEKTRAEEAMRRMQKAGQRFAVVVGEDQRPVGIITLGDLLKALFGEVNL